MNVNTIDAILLVVLLHHLPLFLLFSAATLGIQWVRSRLYNIRFYRPFLLNLVLAWVPIVLSLPIYMIYRTPEVNNWWILPLALLWFLFFPNATYLITEVHHFRDESDVPLWFDTIGILALVMGGLYLGSYSLLVIHIVLKLFIGETWGWIVIVGYVLLSNIGIYLGRFSRLNSWDVAFRPQRVLKHVIHQFSSLQKTGQLLLFALLFSSFVLGNYLLVELNFRNLLHLSIPYSPF